MKRRVFAPQIEVVLQGQVGRREAVFVNVEGVVFMKKLMQGIARFAREDDGVTAIEYGLIAALIAVVIITAVELVGTNLNPCSTRSHPS
jgi:pilus assembly protein Flp/PilA